MNNAAAPGTAAPPPLVQRLPWDFKTTFPQPTPEAIDAGIVSEEDATPDGVRSIHEEHARELLMGLHDLDAVLNARRIGVDPRTGKKPATPAAKERLDKLFAQEPDRLRRCYKSLLDSYESAFGHDAADAFDKAVRAWHAGIEVAGPAAPAAVSPTPLPKPAKSDAPAKPADAIAARPPVRRRVVARLPVPRPLPAAVAAGQFGREDDGKPVRPDPHEVRTITEHHAEKLVDLLDAIAAGPASGKDTLRAQFAAGIAAYAEDFGRPAADQLEAYVRRQASLDVSERADQGWHR
jgi:hypothetical protein